MLSLLLYNRRFWLSTYFSKIFSKIFFQNLLTTARKRATAWGCACACYARLFRRVCVRVAGCGFARCPCPSVRLSAVLAVWCGCPFGCRLSVCGCLWWWVLVGGGVGMRARVFLYGLRNNRKRATAHGLRVSVCLRLRLPSVSVSAVFVRPSILSFYR